MKTIRLQKRARWSPIGVVRNSVRQKIEFGWGTVTSRIELKKRYARGLTGLERFSHAWIIFWLHRSAEEGSLRIVRRPRNRSDLPLVGIFAQRAKRRPNPIAVSVVKIVKRRGSRLWVRGLDAIDGTPVLDIKPYFPGFDRPAAFRVPAWVDRAMKGYF